MCQGRCDIGWVLLLSADSSEDHMGDRGALWARHLQEREEARVHDHMTV